MNTESAARFYRRLGYAAEAGSDCVWYRVPEGFLVRVPHHVVRPPAPEEVAGLLRRHRVLGLRYSLPPGERGQPGGVYLVRDPGYDLPNLQPRLRNRVRKGLKACTVRRVSFVELREHGLPLNHDTLARQQRADAYFTDPARWARFCAAAAACEAMHAWGAFVDGQLAAYSIFLQIGTVATELYQMSRTALLPRQANPALNFTQTYQLARTPGLTAVSFGHVGLDSTDGLDDYKRWLGYGVEPLTFVIWLRPVVRYLLLNPVVARAVALLRQHQPERHTWQRLEAVLAMAAASAHGPAVRRPPEVAAPRVDHAG